MEHGNMAQPGPERPVNIILVGSGAVGCFYASRLHHPQHNIHVSLVARSNYAAVSASGVHLITRIWGEYDFHPTAVYPSVAAAAAAAAAVDARNGDDSGRTGWDYVLVATKALPNGGGSGGDESGPALLAPLVGPGTAIVLLQNGVGIEAPYRARFPANPIVSGIAFMAAEQIAPGTVRLNLGTRLVLGPYVSSSSSGPEDDEQGLPGPKRRNQPDEADKTAHEAPNRDRGRDRDHLAARGTAATAELARWLTTHGGVPDIEPRPAAALQIIRWHKLAINAAINPTSVLSGGLGAREMVAAAEGELRAHLVGVMREIWAVAPRVLGLDFETTMTTTTTVTAPRGGQGPGTGEGGGGSGGSEEQRLVAALGPPEAVLDLVARGPADSRPSMLQDWLAGRPLEVEVILGNPVRMARARGLELPRTQTLYALIRSAQAVRDAKKGRL